MFKQIQKTVGIISLIMFAGAMIAASSAFAVEDAPPTLNLTIPSDPVAPAAPLVDITTPAVTPATFNPVTQTTDISFTISANGFITVEILDDTTQKKLLLNNENLIAGSHSGANSGAINAALKWNGKDSAGVNLPNKAYTVKVTSKQTATGAVLDTATAAVTINTPASDNPVPPVNSNPTPPVDPKKEEVAKINLVNAKVEPKKFNPAIDEVEISYTIFSSYGAKIEVKILNEDKEKVVTLVDKKQDSGKQTVKWYGTKDNKEDGELVDAGTYTYKIIAKNPTTSDTEDTEDGEIEVFISNVINDKDEEKSPKADNGSDQSSQSSMGNTQTNATMALNNANTGEVANTGPEVLFY
ncbi:MAG: hypothetical protein AAB848_01560, partial [Patescibacteria group bacterium]